MSGCMHINLPPTKNRTGTYSSYSVLMWLSTGTIILNVFPEEFYLARVHIP